MSLIGFIFIIGYFGYNIIQAGKAQVGTRLESPFLLLFVAAPLDLIALLKK
jgi:hypothetical protein